MAQDPNDPYKPEEDDDRKRISEPLDDVSEEATIMLDPEAMQRQLEAEMKKSGGQPMGSAAGGAPPPPPPPGGAPPPPPPMSGGTASFGGGSISGGEPPNTTPYLIASIAMTLCCCLPLGVVGIVFSALAMGDVNKGEYAAAEQKLKNAKLTLIIGLVLGLLVGIGWLLLNVVVAAAS